MLSITDIERPTQVGQDGELVVGAVGVHEDSLQQLLVDHAHLLPANLLPRLETLAVDDSVVDAFRLILIQSERMSQLHQEPLLPV